MSGIGPVVPADTRKPVDGQDSVDRDGKPPRRPPKRRAEDDLVEIEPRKLDLEA